MKKNRTHPFWRRYFVATLVCFVWAALAGVWMRLVGVGVPLPDGVQWDEMRHAHSHLMFFSWVTPALMLAIGARLGPASREKRILGAIVGAAIVIGICSFFPFMRDGYGSSIVFGRRVPLSVIFSTLSMFTWYAFAIFYIARRKRLALAPRRVLDIAVASLVVGSLGAWLRGAFIGMGVADRFATDGAVHSFLTTFSMGWLLLGVVGLLHSRRTRVDGRFHLANGSLVAGLPLLWVLAVPPAFVPEPLWTLGMASAAAFGFGLFLHVGLLWRGSRRAEKYVLLPLLLIALAQFASGFPGVVEWADGAALRIVFLHLVLLGTVSVFLVQRALGLSIADPRRAAVASIAFTIAAWLLVFTMLPLTSIYPGALRTPFDPHLIVVGAAAPPATLLTVALHGLYRRFF